MAEKKYSKRVEENLAGMGAPAHEWSATGVIEMQTAETGGGGGREMPVFAFPEGYSSAPSAYKDEGCCHLCGTDIKNTYWIQNDTKRWIMPVGSECVTHFGPGLSGEKLAKETVREAGRDLLAMAIEARRDLWKKYSKVHQLGYGRTEKKIPREHWVEGQLYEALKGMTAGIDVESYAPGSVTRWVKRHGERARGLIDEARARVDGMSVPQERRSRIAPGPSL